MQKASHREHRSRPSVNEKCHLQEGAKSKERESHGNDNSRADPLLLWRPVGSHRGKRGGREPPRNDDDAEHRAIRERDKGNLTQHPVSGGVAIYTGYETERDESHLGREPGTV